MRATCSGIVAVGRPKSAQANAGTGTEDQEQQLSNHPDSSGSKPFYKSHPRLSCQGFEVQYLVPATQPRLVFYRVSGGNRPCPNRSPRRRSTTTAQHRCAVHIGGIIDVDVLRLVRFHPRLSDGLYDNMLYRVFNAKHLHFLFPHACDQFTYRPAVASAKKRRVVSRLSRTWRTPDGVKWANQASHPHHTW